MSDIIAGVLVPDGQAGNVMPLHKEMVSATKANAPGALHDASCASEAADQVTVVERYQDAAMVDLGDFGAHFATRVLAVFGAATAALRDGLDPFNATFDPMIAGFPR